VLDVLSTESQSTELLKTEPTTTNYLVVVEKAAEEEPPQRAQHRVAKNSFFCQP
jgi:hypothetical protein